jgi:hypothetical protein
MFKKKLAFSFNKNIIITPPPHRNTYFIYILPAPLYTVTIPQEALLCPFQKKFVIARPAIVAKKA